MKSLILLTNLIIFTVLLPTKVTSQINKLIEDNQFKDVAQRVKQLLGNKLDVNGTLNINKWFADNMQDPYYINQINVSESGAFTSYKGNFRKMQLIGLKTFQIETIELNVGLLDFNVTARIPSVSLSGQYKLKGQFTLFPFSGNGSFFMNFTDIVITCLTSFTINPNQGTIKVSEVTLDAVPEDINLYFDDLFGGGAASAFSNSLLNALSHSLFEGIKSSTLPTTEARMKKQINQQLDRINIIKSLQPTSNSIIDGWIERARGIVKDKGYDPYNLPESARNGSSDLILFKVHGMINNGTVNGLSTLIRTGPVKVIYVNDSLILEVTMGFESLTCQYDWMLTIGKSIRFGKLSINITSISTFTRLVQPLRSGAQIALDQFEIKDLGHLWVDINGLGTSDYVLEIFTNLAINSFKSSIGDNLAKPIEHVLKSSLDKQKITFI